MKEISISHEVTVGLNEYGKQVWEKYAYSYSNLEDKNAAKQVITYTLNKINDNNQLTTSLWEIMKVFGPTIMKKPFSSEILINEKDLTDIQNESVVDTKKEINKHNF